ncbi:hypothetical protein BHE90_003915 [Fusarium euwallaceae]|uniref:Cyclase n=1 Tax=Fusarium euwallaceae TaxID=1147111 RepID=A0A430M0T7_9HYPO|nr:hypothetical protein BHE90_003915 [Fusarium euwallaceae]
MTSQHPSFDSLPLDKNGPHGNAWGLWGPDDQLGTLNLLTDEVVSEAAKENIKAGSRVSLNSQWDGFRHYAYQKEALYYMGRTAEQFAASDQPNSVHHVSAKGIAGRAVFIDWYTWAQKQGLKVDAMSSHEVPFSELIETLKFQGIDFDIFKPGDILVIRFGYLEQYENMSQEKRQHLHNLYKTQKPDNIGLKPSKELLRFLWDKKIAAICGDSRSLEVWPCKDTEWHLHEWLLAGWGMPIGELFYLEELAKMCSSSGRYTFFMSSSPMNVPGAVASPPNALAFF